MEDTEKTTQGAENLNALKKEELIERLKAAEEKNSAQAERKEKTAPDDMVPIKLYKDGEKYKNPLFVGINGKTWFIPRGIPFLVPRMVSDFIESNISEEAAVMEKLDKMEEEFAKADAK